MEPESPTGLAPGDNDDDYDDGDGEVAAGGSVSATLNAPRGTRQISDKVRQLAKDIAAKHKAANPGDVSDFPSDDDVDYDAVPLDPAPTPRAAGAPPPPSPSGAPQAPAAAAPSPPSPTLDP